MFETHSTFLVDVSCGIFSSFCQVNSPRDLPSPQYQQRENSRDSCWCHAAFCVGFGEKIPGVKKRNTFRSWQICWPLCSMTPTPGLSSPTKTTWVQAYFVSSHSGVWISLILAGMMVEKSSARRYKRSTMKKDQSYWISRDSWNSLPRILNMDLPTSITGPWRTHMDSFLSSRTLSTEEISQVRETGVILHE